MRVASCVSVLAVCVGLAGCKSTPTKPSPTANTPGGSASTPFWAEPSARGPTAASLPSTNGDPVGRPGNDPEVSGLLAGRLVDGSGQSPGLAYVRVAKLGDRPGPPIDVEVSQGYFTIPGLQPGQPYRLIARAKVDGRLLVGEVQARPPETKLLIPMSEDLAGAATPPPLGAPQPPRARSAAPVRPASPAAELGAPQTNGPSFGPALPQPDQMATGPYHGSPVVGIPSPNPTPVPPPAPGLPASGPIQPQSYNVTAPSPAFPTCLIANGRLQYMTLPDLDGGTWDFAQHHGRLVLLDFWGTWCGPCVRAIPELVRLQSTYRNGGLEVVGVACENVSPITEAARRVREARHRIPSINYRLVLAAEHGRCPVQAQFRIIQYPTLVLLDADGTILWRGGPEQIHELEQRIRQKLGGMQ